MDSPEGCAVVAPRKLANRVRRSAFCCGGRCFNQFLFLFLFLFLWCVSVFRSSFFFVVVVSLSSQSRSVDDTDVIKRSRSASRLPLPLTLNYVVIIEWLPVIKWEREKKQIKTKKRAAPVQAAADPSPAAIHFSKSEPKTAASWSKHLINSSSFPPLRILCATITYS